MKKYVIATLMAGCLWATGVGAVAGEPEPTTPAPPVEQQSQWERFKAGAREAGSAIAAGTKSTAKKAGHAIAEGYEESKDYIQEKLDD